MMSPPWAKQKNPRLFSISISVHRQLTGLNVLLSTMCRYGADSYCKVELHHGPAERIGRNEEIPYGRNSFSSKVIGAFKILLTSVYRRVILVAWCGMTGVTERDELCIIRLRSTLAGRQMWRTWSGMSTIIRLAERLWYRVSFSTWIPCVNSVVWESSIGFHNLCAIDCIEGWIMFYIDQDDFVANVLACFDESVHGEIKPWIGSLWELRFSVDGAVAYLNCFEEVNPQ